MRILACLSAVPSRPLDGFGLMMAELCGRLGTTDDLRVLAAAGPQDRPTSAVPHLQAVAGARTRPPIGSAVRALATRRPLTSDHRVQRLLPAVDRAVHEHRPEVVLVSSGRLSGLGPVLQRRGVPAVLVAVDARHLNVQARIERSTGVRRQLLERELVGVLHAVRRDYPTFADVVTVTAEDARALHAVASDLRPVVIANGVDIQRYSPHPAGRPPEPGLMVLTGTMDYAPNITAAVTLATDVLPRVRARVPAARVAIVGRRPHPHVRALAELDGVEVTGEVPDVVPWLRRASVFVCPMSSGSGIKNKVLEAMSSGRPCVVTSRAAQGIDVVSGREVMVADGPAEIAVKVADLLADPLRAEQLGAAARQRIRTDHSWDSVAARHREVLASAALSTAV